jgi:hypothetical protein
MNIRLNHLIPVLLMLVLLTGFEMGCDSDDPMPQPNQPDQHNQAEGDPHEGHDDAKPEAGIHIPSSVRDNIGITFANIELRTIRSTRRVPGTFELRPDARREYHALLGGRLTLHVRQFETVEEGKLLLTVNSPQWRQIQHDAVEAEGEIIMAEAQRDVLDARLTEGNALLAKITKRLKNLREAGTRNAELEAQATSLEGSIPRITAELAAQKAAVKEAYGHYQSRLKILSSITGISLEDLNKAANGESAWQAITELEVRATGIGTVESLDVNDGGWIEAGKLALTTVDRNAIQFHAEAPQSDITLYRDGQSAQIVPPQGGSIDLQDMASGTLMLGLTAHAEDRTFPLYVTSIENPPAWARAGVSAFLEVELNDGAREEWAIPLSAVIQDGLEHVFYRRDPDKPDRALRVVADMGEDDGRWVAIKSGVMKGDQIVLDGAYALKLTSSGDQAPDGFHYHADGSLHTNH